MSLVVELPKKAQDNLSYIAKERNISQENLVKELVLGYLQDLEDLAIAIKGREDRLNGDKGTPASKVFQRLGI